MGCEYSVYLDKSDEPVTPDILEKILCRLPGYHGKNITAGQVTLEFRGPDTLAALHGPPDVNVGTSGYRVTLCQFGDYNIAAHVLGVLVMELVSESRSERIEVVKP
ncbi:hypothetical protein Enr10x_29190 [Gimesia panareensis]|uniref:Uncharacterized protein n=1 Tax=Gimesia panareensis TaxID=2527978 RepID=A0A517Q7P6_9PLAN|nr:hypothetical protein Enr10x_29190 [Gimesia panareensis]